MTKDEAIEWLSAMRDRNDYQRKEALGMAIETLKNQWVPCNERLPEKKGMYLVTVKDYVVMEMWSGTGWWATKPIAWMPLPEAYEGRTE